MKSIKKQIKEKWKKKKKQDNIFNHLIQHQ